MQVVVYAEDLSGRKDDGYYTKPDLAAALDLFFDGTDSQNFVDDDGAHPITRAEVEDAFGQDRRVTFYNSDGEKVVISIDPSASH